MNYKVSQLYFTKEPINSAIIPGQLNQSEIYKSFKLEPLQAIDNFVHEPYEPAVSIYTNPDVMLGKKKGRQRGKKDREQPLTKRRRRIRDNGGGKKKNKR